MNMTRRLVVIAAAVVVLLAGWIYLQTPKTYEDCILAHVKAGMSNTAASVVTRACRAKFPTWRSSPVDYDPFEDQDTPIEKGRTGRAKSTETAANLDRFML